LQLQARERHPQQSSARRLETGKLASSLLNVLRSRNHTFDAPHYIQQVLLKVLVSWLKTCDNYASLALSMDILFLIERHANMGNCFAAEEDQVAFLHLRARHAVRQRIMLLIGVARNT